MPGRIRRQQIAERLDALQLQRAQEDPVCPLCNRPIPASEQDAHHFVPKSRGGRETRLLHWICHRQVHALFDETTLARHFNTPEALKAHPEMARFLNWIAKRPPEYRGAVRRSKA